MHADSLPNHGHHRSVERHRIVCTLHDRAYSHIPKEWYEYIYLPAPCKKNNIARQETSVVEAAQPVANNNVILPGRMRKIRKKNIKSINVQDDVCVCVWCMCTVYTSSCASSSASSFSCTAPHFISLRQGWQIDTACGVHMILYFVPMGHFIVIYYYYHYHHYYYYVLCSMLMCMNVCVRA